jgi:hypothetical protein
MFCSTTEMFILLDPISLVGGAASAQARLRPSSSSALVCSGLLCQIRFSPVCIVMNKLPAHLPVFILTPSQRPTLNYIYTLNLITLLYSTII